MTEISATLRCGRATRCSSAWDRQRRERTQVGALRGRKRPPKEFPRIRFEVLPPEVERQGLDTFVRIDAEISEVVERRRAAFVVVQIVRPKFIRKGEVSRPRRRQDGGLPPQPALTGSGRGPSL